MKSVSGLAVAASTVACDSAKPTATIASHPSETMLSMFGPYSVSAFDSACFISEPSSSVARTTPS